jgi:hypothetical protein
VELCETRRMRCHVALPFAEVVCLILYISITAR